MTTETLSGQAHLYLASPDDWTGGDRLADALGLLSAAERQRYERFRVEPPARAFATGRALTRRALSLYAPVEPAEWRLEPDEHGRPRIVEPRGLELDFNLTHDDRLVVCLVTGGGECGVDVESLSRRVEPVRIARHSFGEKEVDDLERRTGADRRRRFFTYWTLKEAYLKARGRGIAMRMDSALFRFPGEEAVEISFPRRVGDRADDWQFALYRVATDQLLAVALRRQAEADVEIHAFRADPETLRAAEADLELERSSRPAVGAV